MASVLPVRPTGRLDRRRRYHPRRGRCFRRSQPQPRTESRAGGTPTRPHTRIPSMRNLADAEISLRASSRSVRPRAPRLAARSIRRPARSAERDRRIDVRLIESRRRTRGLGRRVRHRHHGKGVGDSVAATVRTEIVGQPTLTRPAGAPASSSRPHTSDLGRDAGRMLSAYFVDIGERLATDLPRRYGDRSHPDSDRRRPTASTNTHRHTSAARRRS